MAARAMWKAQLQFGTVEVPIKLYAAVRSDRGVSFRLLDEKDRQPIQQRMVDPSSGDVVEYEEVHRAFPTEGGELVMLDEEELEELAPEPSREIRVSRFVKPELITHLWYDRPYYLGPDGSEESYFALAEALRKENVEGVAHWVMRNKEYVGALREEKGYLALITLRHAGEVVPASALPAPAGRTLDKREIAMAKQLVEALAGDLDLSTFRDEYRERVLELVNAKAEGKVVKLPKASKKKAREESLAEMLEASIAATKGKKSA